MYFRCCGYYYYGRFPYYINVQIHGGHSGRTAATRHRRMQLFTENPELKSVSYMLSDFFQFGLTEDLKLFWDGHQETDGMVESPASSQARFRR